MTWRSFIEYVTMRELGQEDSIVRNYDLANLNGSKPGVVLDRAYAMMGFDQLNTARSFILPDIRAKLNSIGYRAPNDVVFADIVRCWYNWHRIRAGIIRSWPYRPRDNPLI